MCGVCVCMCMCMCMYVCMYVCMCVCVCMCMCMCMYVCLCVCECVYLCVCYHSLTVYDTVYDNCCSVDLCTFKCMIIQAASGVAQLKITSNTSVSASKC